MSYGFLFWLPHYLKEETDAEADPIAHLANNFDYGSIVGGIVAGFLSDQTRGLNALICTLMLIPSIPLMYVYNVLISDSCQLELSGGGFLPGTCYTTSSALLFILGMLINGPFSLITTAVSAELGQHESLKGSSKALATVSAIIDGTESIGKVDTICILLLAYYSPGAAVGPLIANQLSTTEAIWMLMGSATLAILFLARLLVKDVQK